MTLADITAAVRDKLGDAQFSQTSITDAANWFVNSLFTDYNIRFMESSGEISVSAGDTVADLPDDFQTVIKEGIYVTSPQVYDLAPYFMEYGDFMKRFPGWATYTANAITYWTDFSNQMRFSAPAASDTTISVDYLRVPNTMSKATDTCEVPDVYEEMVVLGTLARCMQTNEDYPEASQELANLAPLVTAFVATEGRGRIKTGPTVMRTNRRGGSVHNSPWGW